MPDEKITRLAHLRLDLQDETANLEEAATRWLETTAHGRDTSKIDIELAGHERATRRLERKIHRLEKKVLHGN